MRGGRRGVTRSPNAWSFDEAAALITSVGDEATGENGEVSNCSERSE